MKQTFHLLGRTVRLTGQKLDRLGLKIGGNEIYQETWSRHRPVMNLFDKVIRAIDIRSCLFIFDFFSYCISGTNP
jgi:hypothetical protein